MKTLVAALVLLVCAEYGFSQDKVFDERKIDSTLNALRTKWKIPGMSVAIAKDGKLIYAKGLGLADTTTHEPVTANSLFRIASCSKTITAIGVLKLVEQKKFGFDDKVFGEKGILNNPLFRSYKDSRIKDITVRHLLQQTIGWYSEDIVGSNNASAMFNTPYPSSPTDIIRFYLQKKLDFSPGAKHVYCNFNYLLLGEIIKEVTKRDYEEYIQSEVLHPIGVYTARLGKTRLEDKAPNEVHYYDSDPTLEMSVFDSTKNVPCSYGCFDMKPIGPSGGWTARATDLVRIMLSIDGNDQPKDLLKPSTLETMQTPRKDLGSNYAMGIVLSEKGFYHTGALTWGTSSVMFSMKNGLTFAIICNTLCSKKDTLDENFIISIESIEEMTKAIPSMLSNTTSYPRIDLFKEYLKK